MHPTIETRSQDLSLFAFRDMVFPNHLHTQLEMLFPMRGSVTAIVDEKRYEVRPGEVLAIFPDLVHSYAPTEGNEGVLAIVAPGLLPGLGIDFGGTKPREPVVRLVGQDLRYCARRLWAQCGAEPPSREVQIALLHLLLVHLRASLRLAATRTPPVTDMLYQAVAHISRYADQPLTIRSVASALGINEFYLSHLINEKLHMGFRAYLNTLRVDRARSLLLSTSLPVEEVCDRCGFGSLRTFDRVFGQINGCTPSAYRRGGGRA